MGLVKTRMAQSSEKEEKKDNIDVSNATQNYNANQKLYYCEKKKVLTSDHLKMFNDLRLFVDSVLCKKIAWELSELPPKLLSLVEKYKPSKNQQEEQKNNGQKQKRFATPQMYAYLSNYATQSQLIRSITGSDYRLNVAQNAILQNVQWRVESRVDEITPNMFEHGIKSQVIFSMNQRDKRNHIVCYFKVLKTPPSDPWVFVRAAIFTIEKGIKMAEQKGVHQIMWLLDIENLAWATLPPLEIMKEIAHLMQYYYPERLFRAYILFSPWVFRAVWKLISGLLTENTKGKVIVPGWYESAKYETFEDNIGKNSLLKRFGGNVDLKYSFEWELEQFNKTNGYKN